MQPHLNLEISLISAQGLRVPAGPRRLQAFAVIWVDPAIKLRTLVDRTGGENPTWNDKFIFYVPQDFLADDSAAAINIEIYASGGWYLPDSLVGTVRLLVGNLRLLSRRRDQPAFDALGIRRPSGRLYGMLNVGASVLKNVSFIAAEALSRCPAIGYRDLMEKCASSKARRPPTPVSPPDDRALKESNMSSPSVSPPDDDRVLKESKSSSPEATLPDDKAMKDCNRVSPVVSGSSGGSDGGEVEESERGGVLFCGPCVLGLPRRMHLSPSGTRASNEFMGLQRPKDLMTH